MNVELKHSVDVKLACRSLLVLAFSCIVFGGCHTEQKSDQPYIEFTRIPFAEEGGTQRLDLIEGRVVGAGHDLRIVLFARSGRWYVQPFADQPFTEIQSDSRWNSATHLGTEYAALLVGPGYSPPPMTDSLPRQGDGVIAVLSVKGQPVFWKRWWFLLLCVLASLILPLGVYSYWLRYSSKQLNVLFEERLAERTRVAQDLHDTLLQGVISASMQLHVAVDHLPEDLPAKPSLNHVLQVMGQVVEEGRSALHQLRSSSSNGTLDIEQAFSRIPQELDVEKQISFRVTVEGRPRPVHPIIRDEVYRIGREALVNAFRSSSSEKIEVKLEYRTRHLCIIVRDEGSDIFREISMQKSWFSMRERAQRIGARLRVRRNAGMADEIELSVPGDVAFQNRPSKNLLGWLTRWKITE